MFSHCGRHVKAGRGDQTCFLWEGNEPGHDRRMSYKEVLAEVSKLVRSHTGRSAAAGPQQWGLSSASCTDNLAILESTSHMAACPERPSSAMATQAHVQLKYTVLYAPISRCC